MGIYKLAPPRLHQLCVEVFKGHPSSGESLSFSPCWQGALHALPKRRRIEGNHHAIGRPSALALQTASMMLGSLLGASARAEKRWQWVPRKQWPKGLLHRMSDTPLTLEEGGVTVSSRTALALLHANGWPEDISPEAQDVAGGSNRGSRACYTARALASLNWAQPLSRRNGEIWCTHEIVGNGDCEETYHEHVGPERIAGLEEDLTDLIALTPDGDPEHVRVLLVIGS